jgi:hypothetical protein
MMRMWKLIALTVLLLGIAAIIRLYWGGFVWKSALSNDTIVVLFLGVIAFLAVMIQIEEDRNRRRDKREWHKRAVARLVLCEIDEFYRRHIRDAQISLESIDPGTVDPLPLIKPVETNAFPVYYANSVQLADLDQATLANVMAFYNVARGQQSTAQAYHDHVESVHRGEKDEIQEEAARAMLRQLKEPLPLITELTFLVCHQLCEIGKVPFEAPAIAVAAETAVGARIEELKKDLLTRRRSNLPTG